MNTWIIVAVAAGVLLMMNGGSLMDIVKKLLGGLGGGNGLPIDKLLIDVMELPRYAIYGGLGGLVIGVLETIFWASRLKPQGKPMKRWPNLRSLRSGKRVIPMPGTN